jgi:DNA-binding PadR family transcriptional regulator
MMRLTEAQRRAIEWIPADGSWKAKPGKLTAALSSLSMAWPGGVQCEWAKSGPRGGTEHRWRLTEKGVEIRSAL